MSKCIKCGLEILDETERCPLCQHVLQKDSPGKRVYPDARPIVRKLRFFVNLVLFLSLIIACLLGYINWNVNPDFLWSVIVWLVLLYVNVVIRLAILGKNGYMFKTISLIVTTILILWGIDYMAGYQKWSLNYVLPGGILFLDAGILFLMIFNHRNWQSYMMAELFTILLSVVTLLMLHFELLNVATMPLIAFWVSVFLFLGTLILGDQRARSELYRRFHF